ncbi:hypothetical protein [Nocardia wallacei]|uniref:hypothetical protein n=1 Tax=Nocardia wallacei TaxID=480035 RepID=UPI002455DED0|nr:hypothetical protein [Nocardia wallacei]
MTTTTTHTPDPLRPLPIRPRPQPGDDCLGYIRRLAVANHMRPAHLRRYLQDPNSSNHIRLDRLAVLSGRSPTALQYALTDLHPDPAQARPAARRSRPALPRAELFRLIRRDARRGMSINALGDRYGVGDRTVHQALQSPNPQPRKQYPQRASRLEPFIPVIDAMLEQELTVTGPRRGTIQSIHDRLVTEHAADVSYSVVRTYVAHRRRTTAHDLLPPTHQSVDAYDLERLRIHLDLGDDVDTQHHGRTLLHHAIDIEHARHGSGEPLNATITAFLLARGANGHRPTPRFPSPIAHAADLGHWLAVELIRASPHPDLQQTI